MSGQGHLCERASPAHPVSSKVRASSPRTIDVQSFTEACESNNQRAGAHLMSIEEVEGLDDARAFFGFGNEGRLLRVVRIRTADRTPIMVEENYFPAEAYASCVVRILKTLRFTTSFCPTVMASRCSPSRAILILRKRPPSLRRISLFPSASRSSALRAAITIPTGRPCTWQTAHCGHTVYLPHLMCAKSAPDWGRRGTASVQSEFRSAPVSMRSNVPMVSPWGVTCM